MNEQAICPVCQQPVTPNQRVVHHPNYNTYHEEHYPKFAAERVTTPEAALVAHQTENAAHKETVTRICAHCGLIISPLKDLIEYPSASYHQSCYFEKMAEKIIEVL